MFNGGFGSSRRSGRPRHLAAVIGLGRGTGDPYPPVDDRAVPQRRASDPPFMPAAARMAYTCSNAGRNIHWPDARPLGWRINLRVVSPPSLHCHDTCKPNPRVQARAASLAYPGRGPAGDAQLGLKISKSTVQVLRDECRRECGPTVVASVSQSGFLPQSSEFQTLSDPTCGSPPSLAAILAASIRAA